ncbi:unnamed protein product [Closterium sp. NIES-64]|nr:unnamed protein product [Closterium sp. NIES-64]
MGAGASAPSAAATLPADYSIWDNMSHSSDEEETGREWGRSLGGGRGENAPGQGAKVRAGKRKGAAEMGATGGGGGYTCDLAPHLCAEEMLLEWMAEPRVGVLMDLGRIRSRLPAIIAATGLFAPTVEELGAHRQEEEDCLATVLVQVLGMKGGEEINDGFKAHVLPLLPGGAEAHRESEGRAGRNGEKREAGRNGGRREGKGDGGAGNSGEWSQGLEGPVWDRYVGGMACLLAHDGRDEMRAPKAASSINSDPNGSLSIRISKNFISSGIPKGMFVSGIDATGFALAVAAILSKPQFSEDACRVFFTDANNEYRVKLENSATEAARKKVGMGAERAGELRLV